MELVRNASVYPYTAKELAVRVKNYADERVKTT